MPVTVTNKAVGFYRRVHNRHKICERRDKFYRRTLSRQTVFFIDNTSTINYKDLSADQALDTEFTRLRHSKSSTMNFKLLKSFDNNLIWCDVSTGHIRP